MSGDEDEFEKAAEDDADEDVRVVEGGEGPIEVDAIGPVLDEAAKEGAEEERQQRHLLYY